MEIDRYYLAITKDKREKNANDVFGEDNIKIDMNRNMFHTKEEAIESLRKFHELHQMINPGSTRYEYYVRETVFLSNECKVTFDGQGGE